MKVPSGNCFGNANVKGWMRTPWEERRVCNELIFICAISLLLEWSSLMGSIRLFRESETNKKLFHVYMKDSLQWMVHEMGVVCGMRELDVNVNKIKLLNVLKS